MTEGMEHKILEEMRVLLALERNYLAEERTALAEFRTGLTLVLISVPATTVVSFVVSTILQETFLLLHVAGFTAFAILAALGVWMSIQSQQRLKRIKIKKRMLHNHEVKLARTLKSTDNLLRKFIILEEGEDKDF